MKVLLVGDVGEGEFGWRHAGDEAMFLANYFLLKEILPQTILTMFSRSRSHPELDGVETINDLFFFGRLRFIKSLVVAFIYFLRLDFFIKKLKNISTVIKEQDVIWISGGGNLTSLFPEYIVNRFLIIVISVLYKKRIIITGQTLGPIDSWQDSVMLGIILRCANLVLVREKFSLNNYSADNIKLSIDDAFFCKYKIINDKKVNIFKIGVSLRDRDSAKLLILVRDALILFKKLGVNFEVCLIPHIYNNKDGGDIDTMKTLFSDSGLSVSSIDYKAIQAYANGKEQLIIDTTSQMDLLIVSRYHGFIFGAATKVPVISLYENEYYAIKMIGASDRYQKNVQWLCLDARETEAGILSKVIKKVFDEHAEIANMLVSNMRELDLLKNTHKELLKKTFGAP